MLKEFLQDESAGGIFLMIAAALALIVANSPWGTGYTTVLDTKLAVSFGNFEINKALLLWINDGLMALFFFVVGLEVKREILTGQLSSLQQASLPLFAAIGGMAVPALIFLGLNFSTPENIDGWAIPAATDIAFALGILALLGDRVPVALKALLLAIAVIDDIGAILIIALFYSHGFEPAMFGGAVAIFVLMALLGRFRVWRNWPYVVLGLILWVFVLKSGIHATLAGVAAALTVPISAGDKNPLSRMEHGLHPWVTFLVVPIFAFANAGVSLTGIEASSFLAPLPLGIALGLLLGKQIGIFGFAWGAVKMGWASLPKGTNWKQVHGLSLVAGIGFTMSLFIGNLAFTEAEQLSMVKVGVLSGSILSALGGFWLLRRHIARTSSADETDTDEAAA
ncbi:Na+/H+ antiporter NhaA [Altericroceibacterium spongiae]|uniref:Na(+)/H(+) antiporter NhaA n=1 Tax=Altericroceibacterium spongiae TaxID=2320269 RepID=A0A420EJ18_9SPHN|nr:Na+/H+ antiporter NhaA [Altericroceibacterium spongiae]RKF20643.1 Na+/H+ antiporter NhaA [Altericroceibacterium spongiae]